MTREADTEWTLTADKPDGSGFVGLAYGSQREAEIAAKEHRDAGYKNVKIVPSQLRPTNA